MLLFENMMQCTMLSYQSPHFYLWADYHYFICVAGAHTFVCIAGSHTLVCEQMTTLLSLSRIWWVHFCLCANQHTFFCVLITDLLSVWYVTTLLFLSRLPQFCLCAYDHTVICMHTTILLSVRYLLHSKPLTWLPIAVILVSSGVQFANILCQKLRLDARIDAWPPLVTAVYWTLFCKVQNV